jgi:protein-L-isoaspartate(D-aspartate) O-methyltransferase
MRTLNLEPGTRPEEMPGLVVRFYNEQRTRSSRTEVGPWRESAAWRPVEGSVAVPTWAREAIVQIGLLGAAGRLDVDGVEVSGVER